MYDGMKDWYDSLALADLYTRRMLLVTRHMHR